MSTTLTIEGMSCSHCEETVEEALEAVPGVTNATADQVSGTATVEGETREAALVDAVTDAGYSATV